MDAEALPDELPPLTDPGGIPMPSEAPSPSLESLASGDAGADTPAGGSGPAPFPAPTLPSNNVDEVSRRAAEIKREETGERARINAANEARLEQDRARMQKQWELSGIGPDDLKPWDADAAREKFRHNPIEEFGSIGSIFAIVASAFTNRPMQNAFFGSAAAIEAAKQGKQTEYERAYKAWQDNTNLAIKRQAIQSQQFTNAATLFTTDMALGAERAKNLATQYGDRQMANLLDNALYKEAIEFNEKRQQMAIKLAETMPKLSIETLKMNDLLLRANGAQPGSPEFTRALQGWEQDWNGRKYDDDIDFARTWWRENPQGTSEEFSKAFGEHMQRKNQYRLTGGGSVRQPKPEEEAIRDKAKQLKEEATSRGETLSDADAITQAKRWVAINGSAPSGNRVDDIRGDMDQMDNAKYAANANIKFLENYAGGAGVAGRATRLAERVGNIFGSDETARVEFEKRIAYMKMIAPRLLTMSRGRPLAAEAANVNSVIAGLGWGDTTANTLKAMRDFDALMSKMKADLEKRISTGPSGSGSVAPPPPAASPGSEPAWKSAPLAN